MVTLTSPQLQSDVRIGLGKVLLVEDEALIRETVALSLADEGFEVCVADNGQTALEILLGETSKGASKAAQFGNLASRQTPRREKTEREKAGKE